MPVIVGAAVSTGSVGVPASTLPASSPIRQKTFDEHASPVMMRNGSTFEVDHVAGLKGGVGDARTLPSSSAATHSELVEQTSSRMGLPGSMLAADGADQLGAENGAVAVRTRPWESIATHAVLDGHARR